MSEDELLFLDTETTGNDLVKDRLCQVCYKIGDKITTKNFKPTVPISIKAMSITHITNAMVENEEEFKGSETQKKLQKLLDESVLVAHNARFDIAMLESEGMNVPKNICTLRLARYLDEQQEIPEYNLQFLRYYYEISVDADAHSAEGDVIVLEAVFGHLMSLAETKAKGSTKEEVIKRMIDISSQPSLIRRFTFGKHVGELLEDVVRTDRSYLEWLQRTKQEEEVKDEDWIHTLEYYLGK